MWIFSVMIYCVLIVLFEMQYKYCEVVLKSNAERKSGQINLVVTLPFLENSPSTANFSEICGENQVTAFH